MPDPKPTKWSTFTEETPTFTSLYHKAFQMIPKLALETTPAEDDQAGIVMIQLMMASMPDFDDIMTLSSHDGHWGALKLLRCLFERTVVLKYIAQNPTEAKAFLEFDALDWNPIAAAISDKYGIHMSDKAREDLDAAVKSARAAYRQEPCKQCGMRKMTTWTPKSSKELAEITGLDYMHCEAFVLPSKYIHPTYYGTRTVSVEMTPMYNTIKNTHALAVETVLAHQRYFHHADPLPETVSQIVFDFFSVWKYADTDFGLAEKLISGE